MEKSKKKPPNRKARIISGFTTLLLLVAVVGCLYIVLQSMSKGYVQLGGRSLFRVVTGSMEPTIPTGAVLLARETEIEEIEKNDIVCFRSTNPGSEGMIVTHRVIGVYTTPDGILCLRTKGDNNLSVDVNPVTRRNLIGRIAWHTGDGSVMARLVSFISGDFGFLACIVLPVLLVAVWVFRDAAKNLKKEIKSVEERLEQQERQNKEMPEQQTTLSDEEYEQLYQEIESELRKEMEQNAPSDASDEAGDAQPVAEADQAAASAPSEEESVGE